MAFDRKKAAADAATIPIACTLSEEQLAERQRGELAELLDLCEQTDELADGYALRFPGSAEMVGRLSQFIADERECCAFFAFELHCEPQQGPVTLRLRGADGVKEFVRGMLGEGADPARRA